MCHLVACTCLYQQVEPLLLILILLISRKSLHSSLEVCVAGSGFSASLAPNQHFSPSFSTNAFPSFSSYIQAELLSSAAKGYNSCLDMSHGAHNIAPPTWDSDIAHTKERIDLLRHSIAPVRPQSASRLMADMLSSENYDLSSFSDDAQLKPAVPLGFKDLLQPSEAAAMYAAMQSDCDPGPVSDPSWLDPNAAAHPLAHFPLGIGTSQQAAVPGVVTAAHGQYMTYAESDIDHSTYQPMQQAQHCRLASLQTSAYAGHAAQAFMHPQRKTPQQPTSPITPDMVDVARQQCRKRNYADMTDAHAIVGDGI